MNLTPPGNLCYGPVNLIFDNFVRVEPGCQLVSFYHFKISIKDGVIVGHINFKVGKTEHITQYAGHIGYGVLPEYRGNSYSYYACNAIQPFVKMIFDKVIITSDPGNFASLKTIEKLNTKFINEVVIPEDDPSYSGGLKIKKRFVWEL